MGGTSQMWAVEPTPAGTVRLRSSWASGKCIDTVGMGANDGAILQIWQETAGDDQLWTISEVKDRTKRAPAKKAEEPIVEAAPVSRALLQRRQSRRSRKSPLWRKARGGACKG